MAKSDAEKKRITRANKKKAGYVEKHMFVMPEWWPKVKAYRDKLDNKNTR
jgi:hypothetical protein